MQGKLGSGGTQCALLLAASATDGARGAFQLCLASRLLCAGAICSDRRANCTFEQVLNLSALLTRSQAMLSSSRIFTATCSAVPLQVASHTWTSQHTSVRNPLDCTWAHVHVPTRVQRSRQGSGTDHAAGTLPDLLLQLIVCGCGGVCVLAPAQCYDVITLLLAGILGNPCSADRSEVSPGTWVQELRTKCSLIHGGQRGDFARRILPPEALAEKETC